jgi:hypothetical protein
VDTPEVEGRFNNDRSWFSILQTRYGPVGTEGPRGRIGLSDRGRNRDHTSLELRNIDNFIVFLSLFAIYLAKMITPILQRGLHRTAQQSRCFSSSPIAAAQEVKRLGVIGAGQMVKYTPASLPP